MAAEIEERPEKKLEKKERRKHWKDMSPAERSLQAAVVLVGLWDHLPSRQRIGLADEIAKLELGQMEALGYSEIKKALLKDSNKDGLRLRFHPPSDLKEKPKSKGPRPWRKSR